MDNNKNQRIIERVITLPKRSKQERKAEINLFKENFDVILNYADLIISTPEYYHSHLVGYPSGLAYLGGYAPPLGALLELWAKDEFMDTCDACGGKIYIIQAGGSPLSGRNGCLGICKNCNTFTCKSLTGTKPIFKAWQHIKNNLNIEKILRTRGQYFTFKYGLTGEPVPDVILEKGVQPVEISELIHTLKKLKERDHEG